MSNQTIIFIVGPTAVGKSDAAIALARLINGEIISCDSMQVYKGIRIASNKPSLKDLKKVKHHLIDVVSPGKEFDVASFNQLAQKSIKNIKTKGRVPIVVGGSGLYVKILLDGIFEGGERDLKLRERLKKKAQKFGNVSLYNALKEKDPEAASKIHPNDIKRVIRALEVVMTEKEKISEKQKSRRGLWGDYQIRIFGLNIPREVLYEKINRRVDWMFEEGIVPEIKRVKKKKMSRTFKGLIGIKEVAGYLDGVYDLERAKDLIKLNTRHFAKRQWTWFKKDDRIEWIDIKENESPQSTARLIQERIA